jgi:hypothetical protein
LSKISVRDILEKGWRIALFFVLKYIFINESDINLQSESDKKNKITR